jgi:hypothetical protein
MHSAIIYYRFIFSNNTQTLELIIFDGLVKSPKCGHPGESRGPEHLENTGFWLSPE